tara:strand:- start:97 stop:315 length:219 start_codon:yes stop_codon:yes gene_type:complete
MTYEKCLHFLRTAHTQQTDQIARDQARIEQLEATMNSAANELQDYIDGDGGGIYEVEMALEMLRITLKAGGE